MCFMWWKQKQGSCSVVSEGDIKVGNHAIKRVCASCAVSCCVTQMWKKVTEEEEEENAVAWQRNVQNETTFFKYGLWNSSTTTLCILLTTTLQASFVMLVGLYRWDKYVGEWTFQPRGNPSHLCISPESIRVSRRRGGQKKMWALSSVRSPCD